MQAHRSDFKNLGRLKKRSDFLLAGSQGRKWVSKSVIVQVVAHNGSRDGSRDSGQNPSHSAEPSATTSHAKLDTPVRAPALPPHRFGVTASAHSVGNAVERARVKRRLRAAMRDVYAANPLPDGWDIVLIGRKETLSVDYKTLVGDLGWCLKRLNMFADKMTQGGGQDAPRRAPAASEPRNKSKNGPKDRDGA